MTEMQPQKNLRLRRSLPYVGLLLLALCLRLWMPGPVDITADEPSWLMRSKYFSHSLDSLSQGKVASSARDWGASYTMPGATTLWAGATGRLLTGVGHAVGLNGPVPKQPDNSAALLRWSRSVVALWVSLGIAVLAWVATKVVGRGAAFVFGFLLAVEPWFVGHGYVLHTDAFVAIFGFLSILSLYAALDPRLGQSARRGDNFRRRGVDPFLLTLSMVAGGLAIATKVNGAAIVVMGALIVFARVIFGNLKAARAHECKQLLRFHIGAAAVWLAGVAAMFVVIWPETWFHPKLAWHYIVISAEGSGEPARQFFLGRITTKPPGVFYYPITLAFRMSPWLLLGFVAVCACGLLAFVQWRRPEALPKLRLPKIPWILLAASFPYFLVITTYGRQYDRYAIPLLPAIALCVGVVFCAGLQACRQWWQRKGIRVSSNVVIAVLGLAMVTHVVLQAPFAISYVDPLLGGQRVAKHVMLLGWGEGGSHLGSQLAILERGRCDQIRIAGFESGLQVPCGKITPINVLRPGDYFAISISSEQRGRGAAVTAKHYRFYYRPVATTKVHGVVYYTLYKVTGYRPKPK